MNQDLSIVTLVVHAEAKNVHLMAQGNEMANLEKMFDKTVNEGIVKQAATLENLTAADRQKSLAEAVAKLLRLRKPCEVPHPMFSVRTLLTSS